MGDAFLEREAHLEALRSQLARVRREGEGALVLVAGEAGVGKTTLVRRFCAGADAPRVLWGSCDPLEIPAPLGPFVDVAAALDGSAARALAGEARPYEAARALLADLSDGAVGVVVLEDLHWADQGTLDALVYLARRIVRAPVLLVATFRDDELAPAHPLRRTLGMLVSAPEVERLDVQPLSRRGVRELAGDRADAVYAATGGNPFFVTEVLASPPGEVPQTVRDAVLARSAALDDDSRRLLELAAVAGPRAEVALLEQPAGDPRALERCLASGMLERRGDEVSFRHELARLTVEQELAPERAAALHRSVLQALEGTGADPARLVRHAERAAEPGALLRHATAAGARASALGAHREAAEQYERALSASASLPDRERADLLERHAYERYLTDRLDDAVASQRAAVDLLRPLGDVEAEGNALRSLSRFLWFAGRNAEAEQAAAEAVEALERGEPGAALARAYSNVSQLRMLAYDTPTAIEWGTRALALAEACAADEVVVHALANIGSAEVLAGKEDGGRAKLESSLARALELGLDDDVGRAYANLATPAMERRRFALADRYLAEGVAYCEEHDLVSYGLYLRAWRARLALDSGRWRSAADAAAELASHPGVSAPTRIVVAVVSALLAIRAGDFERGDTLLAGAATIASVTGELQRLAPVAAARAEAAWLRGDAHGVDEATSTVAELAAARRQPWLLGDVVAWRSRAGLASPPAEVSPPVAAELAGEHVRAAELWNDLGCPYEAALALAGADDEQALRRSLAELQRLGAAAAARIVSRRLRARGVRTIPRGPYRAARANPAGLTARELEVLTLLAEPLRNGEIADRLVLSRRTVDHHVSRILAKLGAGSRAEAAAAARRLGLTEDR